MCWSPNVSSYSGAPREKVPCGSVGSGEESKGEGEDTFEQPAAHILTALTGQLGYILIPTQSAGRRTTEAQTAWTLGTGP